jgi:DNA-binding CsgD family transcriptional regulator
MSAVSGAPPTSPATPEGTPGAESTPGLRLLSGSALDAMIQPQCSLAVQLRRVTGSIVGRSTELAAISDEIKDARTRLTAVTLEGEPGIGKTRLLLAAAELAVNAGFTTVAITADEEIRGPFLLAQSLFSAGAIREAGAGTPAEEATRRVTDAISGRDEPGFETLSPEAKLLRAFDLAGVAIGLLARARPLAILIDDAQWADDDTLRLLRYVVRSDADLPIFLFLTVRPDEFAAVTEAVNFVADMERMGLVRRLRPGRFSAVETAELLRNVLGGQLDAVSASAMHAQSEGVPFIVEELARSHRDAGTLQLIDGQWRLGKNAQRLIPSAVRTLIQRRAARLPAPTRSALADASVLGRSFSLRDLKAVRASIDGAAAEGDLADDLAPAVDAGLLLPQPEGQAADFTFTHEQVRQFSMAELPQSRRRQVHAAIVDLLLESGDPAPAGLPLLAQHALAAGDTERAAHFSIDAATAALKSNAPEEALRLVEQALPVVSTSRDRRTLLTVRDDAYAVLRRASDRLEGLAELNALAEALRDPGFEFDVQLRRVAAFRMAQDDDTAAELARRVRSRAAETSDRAVELRANLELGQALMRTPIGEGFGAAGSESDLAGAEDAYRRAIELAGQVGDDPALAGASREVAMILLSRAREWFARESQSGRIQEVVREIAAGNSVESQLMKTPIAPLKQEMDQLLERALAIYQRLEDQTGVMSTIIAMAYANYAAVIHLTSSARHLEEIRRVTTRQWSMVTESERARLDLQMLYGVHVYARAKVVLDLMVARGEEAYRTARIQGDQTIEFLAAGGTALAHLSFGDVAEAERWISNAAAAAASAPAPIRARQLELWRGMARATAGDAEGMRRHLEQAVALATQQGRPAARCEALARLALEAARLGASSGSEELLDLAERSAEQASDIAKLLPGHAPWPAQAQAAISQVALARGDIPRAAMAGGAAMQILQEALHEDMDLEILLPASRGVFAGAPPEVQAQVRDWLQLQLSRIARGTVDENIRVRWLRGPVGRELVELAKPLEASALADSSSGQAMASGEAEAGAGSADLDPVERQLLQLLTEGSTNQEMAAALGLDAETVAQRLALLLGRLGASTRAEATSLAFRGLARA